MTDTLDRECDHAVLALWRCDSKHGPHCSVISALWLFVRSKMSDLSWLTLCSCRWGGGHYR